MSTAYYSNNFAAASQPNFHRQNTMGESNSYYQDHPMANSPRSHSHQRSHGKTPNEESERGLLGALGGGATGAWAGHKQGHGFLGALGGAIAGSLAEDALKKKNKKEHNHNHHSNSSTTSSSHNGKHHNKHHGKHSHSHTSSPAPAYASTATVNTYGSYPPQHSQPQLGYYQGPYGQQQGYPSQQYLGPQPANNYQHQHQHGRHRKNSSNSGSGTLENLATSFLQKLSERR